MESNKQARVEVHLPEDVLTEILSRLRVKDLIRFKFVCKSWLHLISSQYFIQLHLKKSSFRVIRLTKMYVVPHTRFLPSRAVLSDDDDDDNNSYSWAICLGSCDGLVCLYNNKYKIIYIWNPATRIVKCIPIKKRPSLHASFYWFGRSSKVDDEYKLILGTKSHIHLVRLHTDENSWKSTEYVRENRDALEDVGTLVDGVVHWSALERRFKPADDDDVPTILSYDLGSETTGKISVTPLRINSLYFELGEVSGWLSTLFSRDDEYELWAMKEYGVVESWTRLMILPVKLGYYHRSIDRYYDEREVILDDPARVKSPLYGKNMYVESLVSPLSTGKSICCDTTKGCAETEYIKDQGRSRIRVWVFSSSS